MPCLMLPFLGFLGVLLVRQLAFYYEGAPSALARWAKSEGFRMILEELRPFFRGPFFLRTSNFQVVYRITVEDNHGRQRAGWARVGSFWGSDWNRVEVCWDRPSTSEPAPSSPAPSSSPMWDRDLDA